MTTSKREISRRTLLKTSTTLSLLSTTGCTDLFGDREFEDEEDQLDGFEIETVVEGLNRPWSFAFLPTDSRMLVTERAGRLILVDIEERSLEIINGTPDVYAENQGGLLDVELQLDFPDRIWVYLTYAAVNDDGESATHLGRGRFEPGELRLANFQPLHVVEPFIESDSHFGSRIVSGDDLLYMTTGDRQLKEFGPDHVSQDTSNELGATLRLALDGSIPNDNPFVEDPEASDAIYSYGHRNVQAMAIHPETGELWQAEHGEEDGDEINMINAGENYGWPIAHYGCEYGTTDPIGDEPHEREDTVDPIHYWECTSGGFSPSGMTFYEGEMFPDWEGDLFIGNLAGEYLGRFTVEGRDVKEEEPLLNDRGWRIRDVKVAPDTGHLYVLPDGDDVPLVRLVPE